MRASILTLTVSLSVSLSPAQAPGADGAVDQAAVQFFLEEGLERSQVMEHLSWLCDVYGPRVTGSPNLRKAQRWSAVRRLSCPGSTPTATLILPVSPLARWSAGRCFPTTMRSKRAMFSSAWGRAGSTPMAFP